MTVRCFGVSLLGDHVFWYSILHDGQPNSRSAYIAGKQGKLPATFSYVASDVPDTCQTVALLLRGKKRGCTRLS